jgi:uncharacterized protein YkwD
MCQPNVRVIARCAALAIPALMLLACGEGGAVTASVASHTRARAATTGPTDSEVASFVRLMNAHRTSRGLSALVWDSRAAAIAQAHSRDMFDRHYFSHTWSDGSSTWDRLAARGVSYSRAGENIAWGQVTGSAVLASWLRSPGHRANIENGSYTHHGVGRVGIYWTHVFLRPTREPPPRAGRQRSQGDYLSHE